MVDYYLQVDITVVDVNDNEPEFIFTQPYSDKTLGKYYAFVTEDSKISTSVLQVSVSVSFYLYTVYINLLVYHEIFLIYYELYQFLTKDNHDSLIYLFCLFLAYVIKIISLFGVHVFYSSIIIIQSSLTDIYFFRQWTRTRGSLVR